MTVPKALAILADERTKIADAIDQLGKFSAIAADTIHQSKESLVNNLRNIAPVLRSLADAGPSLTKGLDGLVAYPWPASTARNWFRGDYANLTLVVDLTLSRIDQGLFTGSRWEGNLTQLELLWGRTIGMQPSPATGGEPTDLSVPLRGILNAAPEPQDVDPVVDLDSGDGRFLWRNGVQLHEAARDAVRDRRVQRHGRPAPVGRALPDLGRHLPRHRRGSGQVGRCHRHRGACGARPEIRGQGALRRPGVGAQPLGDRRAIHRTDPAAREGRGNIPGRYGPATSFPRAASTCPSTSGTCST